ncbi:MAG: site-2 protease family protein [Herpetosiphon sp.]|nr:site-2 protease family protein [Herpetosiphon sp.]
MNFDIQRIIPAMIAIVLGVTIHEFSHAFTALKLGDPTAAHQGRVTLNPAAHFDPLGAMMMFFLILGAAPIAWGKPVPINVFQIKYGRRGLALSSLAGPTSNLLLAAIFAIPLHLGFDATWSTATRMIVMTIIYTNIGLAAFNMIPLPPLDGFNTLSGLLPAGWATPMERLRAPATTALMVLIILPWALAQLRVFQLNINILSAMVAPIYQLFSKIVLPAGGCCYVVDQNIEYRA